MKTSLYSFLATLAALFAMTPSVMAYDCEVDGIYYSRISATEVEVTNKVFSDQNFAAYTGSITIPASVTYNGKTFNVVSIGDYAFRDCSSITSVTIPTSVRAVPAIEDETFFGCKSLKGVIIPESVQSVGEEAFSRCSALISIYCLAKDAPKCEPNAFSKVDRTWCTLYVPKGSKTYKDSEIWREFFIEESEEKPDNINMNGTAATK